MGVICCASVLTTVHYLETSRASFTHEAKGPAQIFLGRDAGIPLENLDARHGADGVELAGLLQGQSKRCTRNPSPSNANALACGQEHQHFGNTFALYCPLCTFSVVQTLQNTARSMTLTIWTSGMSQHVS